jgi:hypothetical protein
LLEVRQLLPELLQLLATQRLLIRVQGAGQLLLLVYNEITRLNYLPLEISLRRHNID